MSTDTLLSDSGYVAEAERRSIYSTFSSEALALLDEYFSINGYPSILHRRRISAIIGETETRVKNWFKRQRTKCLRQKEAICRGNAEHLLQRYETSLRFCIDSQKLTTPANPRKPQCPNGIQTVNGLSDAYVMHSDGFGDDFEGIASECSTSFIEIEHQSLSNRCYMAGTESTGINLTAGNTNMAHFMEYPLVPSYGATQRTTTTGTVTRTCNEQVMTACAHPPGTNINDQMCNYYHQGSSYIDRDPNSNQAKQMISMTKHSPDVYPPMYMYERRPYYQGTDRESSMLSINHLPYYVPSDFCHSELSPFRSFAPTTCYSTVKRDNMVAKIPKEPCSHIPGNISPILPNLYHSPESVPENLPSPPLIYKEDSLKRSLPYLDDRDRYARDLIDPQTCAMNRCGEYGY